MEEHHKGVRYADYYFLLAILFIFLIFFCLLCTGGLIAIRWSYKRRTKEKLDEEREKHRREEDAWKECERKVREEVDRKNEKALDRELQRKYEAKESEPHTTVIKMETPTKLQESIQQHSQQPICNHHNSQQFPTNNGQPLHQTIYIPQPYYSSLPNPYYPPQQLPPHGNFQQQNYFGQLLQAVLPQAEQPQMPLPSRSSTTSSKRSPKESPPKRKVSTKKKASKKSKRENKNDNSSKHVASIKMAEAETSQPSTSTSTLPVPSSTSSNTSCVPQKTNDSDLPCLSSDFEISKLQNSPKKKKNRKHKSPLSKKFRKIKQSTTVTETMAVKKTFPSRGRNPFTSIEATTLPTSRSVTSENTVDHLYYKPTKPKHPKTWKRRKSPVSDISSKDNSLTSVASMTSPSSLSNVIPTRRQNFGFNEIDTDYEKNESDATTTETTRTPKMFEVNETLESETTTLTTSTIQTESSNASTPIITESDEITERTQSPAKNGIQSPTSVSVEMNPSSPLPLKFVQKERTKIECQPRVAAEVVQVLAKHRETDDWRLPNEKFELINEEGESLKKLANSSTTTSTISTKSPLSPTLSTPPSSAKVDKIPQRFSPQFTPRSSKTLADSNDPFLSNNPYWRSRTENVTQVENHGSPNSEKVNGIEIKNKETALGSPMENKFEKQEGKNNNKLPGGASAAPAELHRAQVIEIIKTDKTQESP